MTSQRWVILGLAQPRAGWFAQLARWSTAAAVPVDFVKCVSVTEVLARLRGGRSYSALFIAAGSAGLDRDLIDEARSCGAAVILVVDGAAATFYTDGISAQLPAGFGRAELLATLTEHAPPVGGAERDIADIGSAVNPAPGWLGHLIAVTSPGGSGASLSAMALAQQLSQDASNRGLVLLADLALNADQAMLHDARDIIPGITEFVEASRRGRLGVEQIRTLVFDVSERGYHLLLGLRRHRDWTAIRPRSFEAALDGLRRAYRIVIADIESDVEGELETGSLDLEDRNLLARTISLRADVVVVVGSAGLKGLHSLVRTITNLIDAGVAAERILPTVARAPRSPRHNAEVTAILARLLQEHDSAAGPGKSRRPAKNAVASNRTGNDRTGTVGNAVFLPERREVEDALRQALPLPDGLGRNLAAEVCRRLQDCNGAGAAPVEPVEVAAGRLASLTPQAP